MRALIIIKGKKRICFWKLTNETTGQSSRVGYDIIPVVLCKSHCWRRRVSPAQEVQNELQNWKWEGLIETLSNICKGMWLYTLWRHRKLIFWSDVSVYYHAWSKEWEKQTNADRSSYALLPMDSLLPLTTFVTATFPFERRIRAKQ